MTNAIVRARDVSFGNALPLSLIAGPCQMESREHALEMASALKEMTGRLHIPFVFKASFDKANRTSGSAARGIGLAKAMEVFAEIKSKLGLPVITDVHDAAQCAPVAEVVDILQIPAFLCRQTDLLLAAAATGRAINVKKGQFLAPWDMKNVIDKARAAAREVGLNDNNFMACERGASFGYNNLVSDMRSLSIMRETNAPVVFDATHSVQLPGGGTARVGLDLEQIQAQPPLQVDAALMDAVGFLGQPGGQFVQRTCSRSEHMFAEGQRTTDRPTQNIGQGLGVAVGVGHKGKAPVGLHDRHFTGNSSID